MNINSNAMSAIVDSLLRLARDGSALHGPVAARLRGAAGAIGSRLLFMLLDRSRGALVGCLLID